MTGPFSSFSSLERALVQARRAPATMGRRELAEQDKNENARRRFANRHCAIAVLVVIVGLDLAGTINTVISD